MAIITNTTLYLYTSYGIPLMNNLLGVPGHSLGVNNTVFNRKWTKKKHLFIININLYFLKSEHSLVLFGSFILFTSNLVRYLILFSLLQMQLWWKKIIWSLRLWCSMETHKNEGKNYSIPFQAYVCVLVN